MHDAREASFDHAPRGTRAATAARSAILSPRAAREGRNSGFSRDARRGGAHGVTDVSRSHRTVNPQNAFALSSLPCTEDVDRDAPNYRLDGHHQVGDVLPSARFLMGFRSGPLVGTARRDPWQKLGAHLEQCRQIDGARRSLEGRRWRCQT